MRKEPASGIQHPVLQQQHYILQFFIIMSQRPIGTNGWQKEIIMKFIRSVGTVGAMQEESGLYLAIGNYFKKVFAAATDRENL